MKIRFHGNHRQVLLTGVIQNGHYTAVYFLLSGASIKLTTRFFSALSCSLPSSPHPHAYLGTWSTLQQKKKKGGGVNKKYQKEQLCAEKHRVLVCGFLWLGSTRPKGREILENAGFKWNLDYFLQPNRIACWLSNAERLLGCNMMFVGYMSRLEVK